MRAALIFILLAVHCGSPSARAEETDFCARPFEAVCDDGSTPQAERYARIEAFRSRIVERVRARVTPPTRAEWLREPLESTARYLRYVSELQAELRSEIVPIEARAVLSNLGRIRDLTESAIDQQIQLGVLATPLKHTIGGVSLVLQINEDLIRMYGAEAYSALVGGYYEACGEHALSDRVYTQYHDGRWFLVVCAGRLIAAVGSGAHAESNFRNLVRVISHELGHTIDSGVMSGLYSDFTSCLANREREVNGRSLFTSVYWVGTRSTEITADFWAIQSVAEYLRSREGRRLNPRGRLEFLREAYAALCESEDDGTHPDGRYRVEVLLRGDAGIQAIMGCGPTPATCAL
jgi:hypothetical protein